MKKRLFKTKNKILMKTVIHTLVLAIFLCFNNSTLLAQGQATIDEDWNITLDEAATLTTTYEADISNITMDNTDQELCDRLSNQMITFTPNENGDKLIIQINKLHPRKNTTWTAADWNHHIQSMVRRVKTTLGN